MYFKRIKYINETWDFLLSEKAQIYPGWRFEGVMVDSIEASIAVAKEEHQYELIYTKGLSTGCRVVESEIIAFLKENGFDFGVTFPSSKLKNLLEMIEDDDEIFTVPVTREEEGVGVCAGAYLAGKKPFMLIQSSGLGNSFNAIASLLKTYRIPTLIIAEYRGSYNEKISAQVPLGVALPGMLDAMEIPFIMISARLDSLEEFSASSFRDGEPHVALISPELF
jgi:sulfopyruvate decarboxylase alpha subunit